jgi:CDGSH-type Zn-finger protein
MTPDDPPPVTLTLYRDGPYIVRGPLRIVDEEGRVIDPGRATVALCRCGRSRTQPFCDGTHNRIGFRGPARGRERVGRPAPADRAPSGPPGG